MDQNYDKLVIQHPVATKFLYFQLFSDIHTEKLGDLKPIYSVMKPKADLLILSGDIGNVNSCNFVPFMKYCNDNWKNTIYVPGNHEYHCSKQFSPVTIDEFRDKYEKTIETFPNIHLLDNDSVEIDGVKFYGSTLWSSPLGEDRRITDYKYIYNSKLDEHKYEKFGLDSISSLNKKAIKYLKDNIDDDPCFVITHFPPTKGLSNPIYRNEDNMIKSYFENDILGMFNKPNILCWIYGHNHYNTTRQIGGMNILSNQIGYKGENVKFDRSGLFRCIFTKTK